MDESQSAPKCLEWDEDRGTAAMGMLLIMCPVMISVYTVIGWGIHLFLASQ